MNKSVRLLLAAVAGVATVLDGVAPAGGITGGVEDTANT